MVFRDDEVTDLRAQLADAKGAVAEAHVLVKQSQEALNASEAEARRAEVEHRRVFDEVLALREQVRSRKQDRFKHNLVWVLVRVGIAAAVIAVVVAIYAALTDARASFRMTEGFVIRRDYHPPYTTQHCTSTGGKNPVTTCHPVHHPERFSIIMADGEHDEREVNMDEDDWRRHSPGDWMCLQQPCHHPHDDARP
jgi:hypothetical protein